MMLDYDEGGFYEEDKMYVTVGVLDCQPSPLLSFDPQTRQCDNVRVGRAFPPNELRILVSLFMHVTKGP